MKRDELEARLAQLDPAAREASLQLLDEITRPLTVREIERALRRSGRSRKFAEGMAGVLAEFDIVAINERAR